MLVNFLSQDPYSSCSSGFQFHIFYCHSVNYYVFPLSALLRVLLTLSPCCLSIRLFGYVLLVAIFYSKMFFYSWILLLVCFRVIATNLSEFSFIVFGMSCFVCTILLLVYISLIFLLSLVISALFPQVVFLFFLLLLFSSFLSFFVLSFLPVFVSF